jgi:hypothetical protein
MEESDLQENDLTARGCQVENLDAWLQGAGGCDGCAGCDGCGTCDIGVTYDVYVRDSTKVLAAGSGGGH